MGGGTAFVEEGATPDGALALGEAYVPGAGGHYIGPATVDRATGKMSVLRRLANPLAQVVSIAGNADWIAWIEGSIQPNLADWVLYSFDGKTGQIRTLVAAPKPDGVHYPDTTWVFISMSNGVIVWSAIEGTDSVYHVYAINADGSGLQVLAANARSPQIVWPWVMYAAKPTNPGVPVQMVLQNIETGEIKDLSSPTDVAYFAYDGSSIAWVTGDTDNIYLMAPIGATPLHIYSGGYLQFVSMNSKLVGWGQDKGAFAYDRKLNVIVQLSSLYDFYPVMSDAGLDWLFQPDPNASDPFANTVLRLVNVADLP